MRVLSLLAGATLLLAGAGFAQSTNGQTLRFRVAQEGNEARYLVREQLLGFDLPNDAVGKTDRVSGGITLTKAGAVVREASRFTIDLAALTSDKDRRDNFLRRRTLDTDAHPHAVFVPTAVRQLKLPLPAAGRLNFQMIGDLTIKGVTRPVTWTVAAEPASGGLRGEAKTSFTFSDFQLEKPRVRSVLSVEDEIRLEYSFFLVPD